MENGVVTVLYFFRKRGYPLKSLHDFWDTLFFFVCLSFYSPSNFPAISPQSRDMAGESHRSADTRIWMSISMAQSSTGIS